MRHISTDRHNHTDELLPLVMLLGCGKHSLQMLLIHREKTKVVLADRSFLAKGDFATVPRVEKHHVQCLWKKKGGTV